jgi:hypothetical protein
MRLGECKSQQQRLLWQAPICIHRRFIVINLNAVAIAALRIVGVPFYLKDNGDAQRGRKPANV